MKRRDGGSRRKVGTLLPKGAATLPITKSGKDISGSGVVRIKVIKRNGGWPSTG